MPQQFGKLESFSNLTNWIATVSGTVQVKTGEGSLRGIFVSRIGTAPALTVFDKITEAAGGTIVHTFTPAAATLYQFGENIRFSTGLHISGGSCIFTTIYN